MVCTYTFSLTYFIFIYCQDIKKEERVGLRLMVQLLIFYISLLRLGLGVEALYCGNGVLETCFSGEVLELRKLCRREIEVSFKCFSNPGQRIWKAAHVQSSFVLMLYSNHPKTCENVSIRALLVIVIVYSCAGLKLRILTTFDLIGCFR